MVVGSCDQDTDAFRDPHGVARRSYRADAKTIPVVTAFFNRSLETGWAIASATSATSRTLLLSRIPLSVILRKSFCRVDWSVHPARPIFPRRSQGFAGGLCTLICFRRTHAGPKSHSVMSAFPTNRIEPNRTELNRELDKSNPSC